jgi:hypothetical protein
MSNPNNPYQGFSSPFVPGYNQPFNQCACGFPDACGNEHQPAIKIERVTRVGATGQQETVNRVIPLGHMYESIAHRAFTPWDGQLALNDLYPSKVRAYRPPALPWVCDRPMAGASLCSAQGNSQCSP